MHRVKLDHQRLDADSFNKVSFLGSPSTTSSTAEEPAEWSLRRTVLSPWGFGPAQQHCIATGKLQ
eukprot:481726-Amphidinium_carterae.1